MAAVTKANVSLCTTLPGDPERLPPLLVGEDIAIGDACYIKSDGKIWRSIGTAVNAAAVVDGYAPVSAKVAQRQPMSLYSDVTFNYATGLTPGAPFYLGTTAGGLDTAATTGGLAVIGRAIDATRIRLKKSW